MTVWQGSPEQQGPHGMYDDDPDQPAGPGGLTLQVFADLALSLRSATAEQKRQNDQRSRLIDSIPGDAQLIKPGKVDAGGDNLVLDLGSVPLGRVFQVRRLIVGGSAITTAAAGAAYVFAQGAPPADLNIANCVDVFATLPFSEHYGTHQLFLQGGDHLFVVIVGGTAAQQYVASARIEDWEQGAFYSTFVE